MRIASSNLFRICRNSESADSSQKVEFVLMVTEILATFVKIAISFQPCQKWQKNKKDVIKGGIFASFSYYLLDICITNFSDFFRPENENIKTDRIEGLLKKCNLLE